MVWCVVKVFISAAIQAEIVGGSIFVHKYLLQANISDSKYWQLDFSSLVLLALQGLAVLTG